jgi:hypothetical protein
MRGCALINPDHYDGFEVDRFGNKLKGVWLVPVNGIGKKIGG